MLNNKTVIVTGAAGLIGCECVKALLAHGAKVMATDISLTKMEESFSSNQIDCHDVNLQMVALNLLDEDRVVDFFESADNIDGAVNCAYLRGPSYGNDFLKVRLPDFNSNVSLQLGTAFLFAQQCAIYFIKRRAPFSLVNISSIYGVVAPKFDLYKDTEMTMPVEYAAVKSALIHLTKYIANYVNHSDFRINCVSPGGIRDQQPLSFMEAYKKETYGKGMLEKANVTGTILFLLSDYAKYMNGQNLVVDDGFSL